ncbi:MAG: glycosyltransferase family 2 protein [Thermoplasmata archaeon]
MGLSVRAHRPGMLLNDGILLLFLGLTLLVLLFQGIPLLLAYEMPRLDPAPAPAGPYPRLSVIVAARNEEEDLAGALDDLVAQDYPDLEILVVDGGSTDGTAAVARARAPRVRLIAEPPLPNGWVGKNFGCHVGAQAATGTLLLFTDADLRYHPSAVRSAYEWMRSTGADLTTLAPRLIADSFWERTVLPFYLQMVLLYFRAPRTNRDGSRAALANGQFWMTSRSAYERVGGHEAVRGVVLEDIRIAQNYRRAGRKLRVAWAPLLLATRMYRDRHEMFEGLLKNIHGTEYARSRQVALLAGLLGLYALPLALLPFGILVASPWLVALGAILYVALFGKHVGFARVAIGQGRYGLLYPLAVGFYAALLLASLAGTGGSGTVRWKGREYAVRP